MKLNQINSDSNPDLHPQQNNQLPFGLDRIADPDPNILLNDLANHQTIPIVNFNKFEDQKVMCNYNPQQTASLLCQMPMIAKPGFDTAQSVAEVAQDMKALREASGGFIKQSASLVKHISTRDGKLVRLMPIYYYSNHHRIRRIRRVRVTCSKKAVVENALLVDDGEHTYIKLNSKGVLQNLSHVNGAEVNVTLTHDPSVLDKLKRFMPNDELIEEQMMSSIKKIVQIPNNFAITCENAAKLSTTVTTNGDFTESLSKTNEMLDKLNKTDIQGTIDRLNETLAEVQKVSKTSNGILDANSEFLTSITKNCHSLMDKVRNLSFNDIWMKGCIRVVISAILINVFIYVGYYLVVIVLDIVLDVIFLILFFVIYFV